MPGPAILNPDGSRALLQDGSAAIGDENGVCEECCGDGGGGGGEWPDTTYVIARPCPGEIALPPGAPLVVGLTPAVDVECAVAGAVGNPRDQFRRCFQIAKGFDGISSPLPPGTIIASFQPNVSCCECRSNPGDIRHPDCAHRDFDNSTNTEAHHVRFEAWAILSGCRGRLTLNDLLRRMCEQLARIKCCCGPPAGLVHSARSLWTQEYGQPFGPDAVEITLGALNARDADGFPQYRSNERRFYGATGAETNTSSFTDFMKCGPGNMWAPFAGLAAADMILSCTDLVSLDAGFTCDRAWLTVETFNAEQNVRTRFEVEGTVTRSPASNGCSDGCQDGDEGGSGGRPGGGGCADCSDDPERI